MFVAFFFDDTNPSEREQIERNLQFYRQRTTGVNVEALEHILDTVSGQNVVAGAVRHFQPDQRFSRHDLADALGTDESRVFAWVRQLGRPESRYGVSVFRRHEDGNYSVSPAMHAAIAQLLADRQQQE
jgi:hypothetical protein